MNDKSHSDGRSVGRRWGGAANVRLGAQTTCVVMRACLYVAHSLSHAAVTMNHNACLVVLVVQRFGVGLVIERSLVRLPAGALSSQL